nr:hypothetical protein [Iningainema tapete]
MGQVYNTIGKNRQAIQFYQQYLEIYQQESISEYTSQEEAISLFYLGLALLKSGKPSRCNCYRI